MPGRPFLFLAFALTTWVGGRAMFGVFAGVDFNAPAEADTAKPLATPSFQKPEFPDNIYRTPAAIVEIPKTLGRTIHLTTTHSLSPVALPWAAGGQPSGLSFPPWVAAAENPVSERGTTPQPFAPERKAGANFVLATAPDHSRDPPAGDNRRLSIYGYSYWRGRDAPASLILAPSSQLGGSQSGLIATWDPLTAPNRGPALLLRTSFTPNGREREIAAGVRWKPDNSVPLSITVERRFHDNNTDRFAAYVSGGVDNVRIIGPLTLDTFGQFGAVSGQNGGGFFDGQVRAMVPLTTIAKSPLLLGAGSWTGGQRGGARLDAGPSVATTVKFGDAQFRLQLDWRFRIAGNSVPESGPAVTVSGGF
jgi:hypothetical protein